MGLRLWEAPRRCTASRIKLGVDMSTDDSDAIKDPETRRLLYEHLKDAPERQLADTNDLDGKAATLFGAASIIMGLASFGNLGTSSTGAIACAITAQ